MQASFNEFASKIMLQADWEKHTRKLFYWSCYCCNSSQRKSDHQRRSHGVWWSLKHGERWKERNLLIWPSNNYDGRYLWVLCSQIIGALNVSGYSKLVYCTRLVSCGKSKVPGIKYLQKLFARHEWNQISSIAFDYNLFWSLS